MPWGTRPDHMLLVRLRKDIRFCRLPAHVSIKGNEGTDTISKEILDMTFGKGEGKAVGPHYKRDEDDILQENMATVKVQLYSNSIRTLCQFLALQ